MMNAFLDFVGVVNRQLPKKNEHRFISVFVTVYDGGMVCLAPGRPVEAGGTPNRADCPGTR